MPDATNTPTSPEKRQHPLIALRHRDYRLLFTSGFLSGNALQMRILLNQLALFRISNDSELMLGLLGAFEAVPILLFGLLSASITDVVNRKKVLATVQLINIFPPLIMGTLVLTGNGDFGHLRLWHIYMFTSISAVGNTFEYPARFGMLARVVPQKALLNAIALNSVLFQLVFFTGPLLAGQADHIGFGVLYLVSAAFYVPGAIAALSIRASGKPEGERRRVSPTVVKEGYRFIRGEQVLWAAIMVDFLLVIVAYFRYYFPVLTEEVYNLNSSYLAWLNGAAALGTVLGIATFLLVPRSIPSGPLFLLAVAGHALAFILVGAAPFFLIGLLGAAAMGYTDQMSVIVRQNIVQRRTPDHMRGRASGFMTVFATVGNGTGQVVAGSAAEKLGVRTALLAGGLVGLGVSLFAAIRWPDLRRVRE